MVRLVSQQDGPGCQQGSGAAQEVGGGIEHCWDQLNEQPGHRAAGFGSRSSGLEVLAADGFHVPSKMRHNTGRKTEKG